MTDLTTEEWHLELLGVGRTPVYSPTRLCLLSSATGQQYPRGLLLVHIYTIPFSYKGLQFLFVFTQRENYSGVESLHRTFNRQRFLPWSAYRVVQIPWPNLLSIEHGSCSAWEIHPAQVQLDFIEGQTCSLWYWLTQSTDNFVRKDCQIWRPAIKLVLHFLLLSHISAVFLSASLWISELIYFNCHLRWSQLKFPCMVWRKVWLYEFQMLKNYKAIILKSFIVEKIGDSSFV